jgi:fucose permease
LFASLSGTAFSILFVIALIGGSLLPLVTGILAESFSLRLALGIIPVSLVMVFIIFMSIKSKLTQ